MRFFVGSYAEPDQPGIYVAEFDPETNQFQMVAQASGNLNPSFLTQQAGGRHLYAVNEAIDQPGSVVAYRIEADGTLVELNRQLTAGAAPCHLSLSLHHRMLVASNYLGGSLCVYSLEHDGRIGLPLQLIQHRGHGPHPERQTAPHPHSAIFDAAQAFLLAPDLGSDNLYQYRIDHHQLALQQYVALPAGSGPRHLTFSADGQTVYLVNELASTITVFDYADAVLQPKQTVSCLPVGFAGESTAADIHLSRDGRHLYASNRGHDSIVVCAIDEEGLLSVVEHVATGGTTPRNFAISPDGNFLLVANQTSDSITAFRIDTASGRLTAMCQPLPVSQPSCVLFAPSDRP